jgi:hypothetical protein
MAEDPEVPKTLEDLQKLSYMIASVSREEAHLLEDLATAVYNNDANEISRTSSAHGQALHTLVSMRTKHAIGTRFVCCAKQPPSPSPSPSYTPNDAGGFSYAKHVEKCRNNWEGVSFPCSVCKKARLPHDGGRCIDCIHYKRDENGI